MRPAVAFTVLTMLIEAAIAETLPAEPLVARDQYGAITRGDVASKELALVFTGDQFGEGTGPVLDALKARKLRGSFFVTGNFLRKTEFKPLVARMVADGHYLGPHSDAHLLYCRWDDRETSLVSRGDFADDLRRNLFALRKAAGHRTAAPLYFIPPYEWYNRDHVRWARELGVTLINFTPGSGSNRDYVRENDPKFVSSRRIFDDILAYESKDPHGLNGFLLLLHLGSGRQDPFHPLLGPLCDELTKRGYALAPVDELLTR